MLLIFRIQLAHINNPPVWRKLVVPAAFSFVRFHQVIQAAFGWQNAHLWFFTPEGFLSASRIKIPDVWDDEEEDVTVKDARKTKLKDVFPGFKKYSYVYDFGDDWLHQIKLVDFNLKTATQAELIGGKGACPPEDCGGPPGYENLTAIMADPKHPGYEEMKAWLELDEKDWDAGAFNMEISRAAVQAV